MISRIPSVSDYRRMNADARAAAVALTEAIRDRALAEAAAIAGRDQDMRADAERWRRHAVRKWHDTPAQHHQRQADLIHARTRSTAA